MTHQMSLKSSNGVELSGTVEITKETCSIFGMSFPTEVVQFALEGLLARVKAATE